MPSTDYLPFATGTGANVDSQADFAGSAYQQQGMQPGIAKSAWANKVWRQSSMMAAAIANAVMNATGQNVPDDGNLGNLITQLGLWIAAAAQTAMTATINAINASIATLNGDVSTLNGEVGTLTTEVSTLNSISERVPEPVAGGAYGTTFTNTNAFSILVWATGSLNSGVGHTATQAAFVNGAEVARGSVTNSSGSNTISFAVPPAGTFEVTTGGFPGDSDTLTLAHMIQW